MTLIYCNVAFKTRNRRHSHRINSISVLLYSLFSKMPGINLKKKKKKERKKSWRTCHAHPQKENMELHVIYIQRKSSVTANWDRCELTFSALVFLCSPEEQDSTAGQLSEFLLKWTRQQDSFCWGLVVKCWVCLWEPEQIGCSNVIEPQEERGEVTPLSELGWSLLQLQKACAEFPHLLFFNTLTWSDFWLSSFPVCSCAVPSIIRTILLSVISLLNEPNTFSPANVDASVMFRKWRDSKGKDKEYAEIIR